MKRLALLALAAATLFAQQPAPASPPPLAPNEIIRVIDVKYASASNIRDNLGAIFPGITTANGRLIVRGQAPVVDMIEDAIKKLDVAPPPGPEARPAPNVELTVQLLQGSAADGQNGPIPADLESTVRQLRGLFTYKSYKLLDTQIFRARSGNLIETAGNIPGTQLSTFQFSAQPFVTAGTAPRSIRLARLRMSVNQPAPDATRPTGPFSTQISGEFDAKEGQKTVVGKANLVNSEDAIILVITPKIIE